MFESAEVGRTVTKEYFVKEELKLQTELLNAQQALREAQIPVVIILSGVEGAGKGEVLNRLCKWLDIRGIQTYAFLDEAEEERERPRYWRFWRVMPARGKISILFGSWYSQPIINRVFHKIGNRRFEREFNRIVDFERLLTDDGVLIVKYWYHLPRRVLKKRIKADKKEKQRHESGTPFFKKFFKRFDEFLAVSERVLRASDTGFSPWHVVEASDGRYRDLETGRILLAAFKSRLAHIDRTVNVTVQPALQSTNPDGSTVTVLDRVDLKQSVTDREYRTGILRLQRKLYKQAWQAYLQRHNTVAVFEGWDASGKGGAIRRVTAGLDGRLYRVISIAAPTDEELSQHYLWRFWRHIPRAGYITIYDRSWYGRVLVERVEKFATETEWTRAYREINEFEAQLCEHGVTLLKFWIHISPDEQLRRFKEREKLVWKQHKITEEDWRNREKWAAYEAVINDMVAHTSTHYAPWTLVAGNDKKFARLQILRTFSDRLDEDLD
ncbi:MAG: polyphosphate:AMP phosphotransferase [Gammaproteobacteria bacterium]|nr:polyphosphate:AMP phosphotransferase [Gammaproteobacteria bacterium]